MFIISFNFNLITISSLNEGGVAFEAGSSIVISSSIGTKIFSQWLHSTRIDFFSFLKSQYIY